MQNSEINWKDFSAQLLYNELKFDSTTKSFEFLSNSNYYSRNELKKHNTWENVELYIFLEIKFEAQIVRKV